MKEAGIYFRVERDEEYQNLDILQLTNIELTTILRNKNNVWKHGLINLLCDLLRDNTEPDPDHFRFQDGTKLEYKQERID